jgi:ATP-dependent DNA helicase RecQ
MYTDLTSNLQTHFGFPSFRPGQLDAIQSLLGGNHTLVVMPTGSGKSLIYQLTALLQSGLTVVISPLIALMKDQVDSLARHQIPATFINSTLSMYEQDKRLKNLARGNYRIVYIAPERLHNLPFLEALHQQEIGQIAVDEAHCVSEWGHDFRPDYLYIASFRERMGNPLTIALTATATPQVQNDICMLMGLSEAHRTVTGFNRGNLFFGVRYTPDVAAKLNLLQEMIENQKDGASIIYVGTRRDAEEVSEFLNEICQCDAKFYHAGLATEQRTAIQDAFMTGNLPVVVATNAFGMGIDRQDVRQVIHYALPGSLESYYQEAGRGGRDGLKANATLLYHPEDRALQEYFIENSVVTQEDLRQLFQIVNDSDQNGAWLTVEDFSRSTGLPEVKVRVGLGQLERCNAIERRGDEGHRMLLHRVDWYQKEIQAIETRVR